MPANYSGVALTLIDSLSTLAVLGDKEEFRKGVDFLVANLTFDVDARVNVFEANIRVLGGLLSGTIGNFRCNKTQRIFWLLIHHSSSIQSIAAAF